MQLKKNNILLIIIFLAAITLPLIFSDKAGGKISTTENRYLASFPNFLSPDFNQTNGIRKELENWINDNVGFRTQIKKLQAYFDIGLFHDSTSSRVRIGIDGWYYFTSSNNLEIAMGTYPLTQDLLEKIKENQVSIQQALKKKGIEFVIVLAPSKVSIYPEYLGGNFVVRETVIDIVSDYLRKNTTIPIINTKPDLLQAKKSELVYFKTDSHWNEAGAYIGYRSVINAFNNLGIIHSLPIDISTVPSTYKGDLSIMMGDEDLFPPEPYQATQIINPNAVKIESGYYFRKMQSLMLLNKTEYNFDIYENPKAEKKKLLIYGDSFFRFWKMKEMLAENFSNLDFIRSFDIRNNLIEQVKPDIVLLEVTERDINILAIPTELTLTSNN